MAGLYPVFLRLEGRLALVVGGGEVAARKVESLLQAGCGVRVVAPVIGKEAAASGAECRRKRFAPADLEEVDLVFACTDEEAVNAAVLAAAKKARVWANAADDPEGSDFYSPALVTRGEFQIAISTSGAGPALAREIRRELEGRYGEEYGRWCQLLRALRRRLQAEFPGPENTSRRRALLERAVRPDVLRRLRALEPWTEEKREGLEEWLIREADATTVAADAP